MAALAEVVLAAEDDDRPPDDRVGADELHVPVLDVHAAGAVLGHLQIAEVAGHPLLVVRAAVVPRKGIKDAARARQTLAEITKNVDVDAVEPRRQAADRAVDYCRLGLAGPVWKSVSELGYAIEQMQFWGQRRVGRLKFDFHTGIHPAPETRTVWSPGKAQPLLKWLDISG